MISIFGIKIKVIINDFQLKVMENIKSEIEKLLFISNLNKKQEYADTFTELINYIIEKKPYLLKKLMKTHNWSIRFEIATKLEKLKIKWLKTKIIKFLSQDKIPLIRAMISILPSTPLEIVKKLTKDKNKLVAEEAKTNDKLLEIYSSFKNYK